MVLIQKLADDGFERLAITRINPIAKQQLDSQDSLVHQYEGTVKSDQAQIQTAKVNLTYTKINAPVSGRVGLRMIDRISQPITAGGKDGHVFSIVAKRAP